MMTRIFNQIWELIKQIQLDRRRAYVSGVRFWY